MNAIANYPLKSSCPPPHLKHLETCLFSKQGVQCFFWGGQTLRFLGKWRSARTHLVSATLARLQAGQDLALDGRHPGVPLLQTGSLKVPRLTRKRHHDEVGVFFI